MDWRLHSNQFASEFFKVKSLLAIILESSDDNQSAKQW